MEWLVQISGDQSDLNELLHSLKGDYCCIEKTDDNQFILKSSEFLETDSNEQIRRKADQLITLLNGAGRLVINIRTPIKIVSVIKKYDENKRHIYVHIEERISLSDSFVIKVFDVNGDTREIRASDPIKNWLEISTKDEMVRRALRLLAEPDINTWGGLYKLFEVIENDTDGNIHAKGWASKSYLQLFTQTANSYNAVGEKARHAHDRFQAPKKPMNLVEAKTLIFSLLANWLREKS